MASESPLPTTRTTAAPGPPTARWRRGLWVLATVITVGPLAGGIVILLALTLPALRHGAPIATLLLAAAGGLLTAALVARTGLRRSWPARNGALRWIGAGAGVMAALLLVGASFFAKVRDTSKLKAMIPRQPVAAADQFFAENPYRIFVRYDELVGPSAYVKGFNPVDGEDLRPQFPLRRTSHDPLSVTLPDGTTVRRTEVLAAIGRSGLVATYPRPEDDRYDARRVYRLDNGVSFRDGRTVDLPPDPAGREGRDQPGVHVYRLPDGGRFEVTYRDGAPDGPFRAFHADGAPWGEATYRAGRVVAAWLLTRDGARFDELLDGKAAQAAVAASCVAAARRSRAAGLEKLAAREFAGAIADLTRALAINGLDAHAYRARAQAHRALGDLDEAIADSGAAAGHNPVDLGAYRMPADLRALVLERGHKRRAAGDAAGAARDFTAIARDAHWIASDALRDRQPAAALRVLDPAIEVSPFAELHVARAAARRTTHDRTPDAEADYTRALDLAAAGRMLIPANRGIHSARWHYERGHVRRWRADFAGATADFRAAGRSPDQGLRTDAALWCFVAQCEAGHHDDARRELRAFPAADWRFAGRRIAACLLGELTDSALDESLAPSRRTVDRINADLLPGLMRRLSGDEAGAVERIRRAARRATRNEIEAEAASMALHGK